MNPVQCTVNSRFVNSGAILVWNTKLPSPQCNYKDYPPYACGHDCLHSWLHGSTHIHQDTTCYIIADVVST